MHTTIDRAGRIVVPKAIRDRLRLIDGAAVEINERDGVIEIAPVPVEVEIVDTPEGSVARAAPLHPPLTNAEVAAALDAVRP